MKKLVGKIIEDKSDKTCLVKITKFGHHPKYQKRVKRITKILAHDENNEFKVGDLVEIIPTKTFSKRKSWKIERKIK